jgi:tRNA threonylcarbamoyladenosine biosynthesis protein TsaB
MITLGFDTATPSTAVALRLSGGVTTGARDDPPLGEHPGHTTRLLALAAELLREAGLSWQMVDRIAVGVGPGTFTGLRVGAATARGLAQSLSAELVCVSSLRALAEAAREPAVLAMIDARRGQVFLGAYQRDESGNAHELLGASALAPEELAGALAQVRELDGARDRSWLAVGDGAVRYRGPVQDAGALVPLDDSPLHRVTAVSVCEIGARAAKPRAREQVLPDYCRRPDAELALARREERAAEGERELEGVER